MWKPSEIADIKIVIKKLKNLVKEKFEGETSMLKLLEYIANKEDKNVPQCYIDLIYELVKNIQVVGIIQGNSRTFRAVNHIFVTNMITVCPVT